MTPGRLLEIAEQHPPELDITDLAKAIARKALAALLDKATPDAVFAFSADELSALIAYVRELESLVERMARSDSNVAIAMRERCAQVCDWVGDRYGTPTACAAAIRALEP